MNKVLTELLRVIEGAVFAASEPMTIEAIAKVFPEERRPKAQVIRELLGHLQKRYEPRGIVLVEVASGFRFQVANDVAPFIAKTLQDKPSRYSRALLETLALIAYRQPITRGEIEDIRGVVVNTYIIKTLEEHEWIRVVGHKDVPGKPALYATTKAFLDHFGLKSLDELPPLAEIKNIEDIFAGTPEQSLQEGAVDKNVASEASEKEASDLAQEEDTIVSLAEEAVAAEGMTTEEEIEEALEDQVLAEAELTEAELGEAELTDPESAEAELIEDGLAEDKAADDELLDGELAEVELAEKELTHLETGEAELAEEEDWEEELSEEEASGRQEMSNLLAELEQDIDETVDEER